MEIKKPFVTHEVAIRLKELGFDEPCACHWERGTDGNEWGLYMSGHWSLSNKDLINKYLDDNNEICGEFSAPTWEEAIKFLLTKVNLEITRNESLTICFNGEYYIEQRNWYDFEGYAMYNVTSNTLDTVNELFNIYDNQNETKDKRD